MAQREPAAIRYKNPGAMWPGPVATKWGSTHWVYLNDGTGQGGGGHGNKCAVFDEWVDGICAQLDLWRSSPKYKNKPFAEAIHTWSGGNDTPAYIRHVKSKIPGMDEDTIMDDDFWQGPMGVKFLMVQAAHEAGKPMPVPESVWLEAQRIVFSQATPESPAPRRRINVQPVKQPYSQALFDLQTDLTSLRYYEVGEPDGFWGGKTRGAVTAFLNDRGIPSDGMMTNKGFATPADGDVVKGAVADAIEEGWTRPIAPKRANATVTEIAKKSDVVRLTLWQRFTSKVGAWVAGLGLGGSSIVTVYDYVTDKVSGAREVLKNIPPEVWFIIIAVLVGVIYYNSRKTLEAAEQDYNTGKTN